MLNAIFYTLLGLTLLVGGGFIYVVYLAGRKGRVVLHLPERIFRVGEVVQGQIEIVARQAIGVSELRLQLMLPGPANRLPILMQRTLAAGFSMLSGASQRFDFTLEIPPMVVVGTPGLIRQMTGSRATRLLTVEAVADLGGLRLLVTRDIMVAMADAGPL